MTFAQASEPTASIGVLKSALAPATGTAPAAPLARLSEDDAWIRSQRVSVLMPTFNRAHFIEEALDSLLQQTRPPDELIVIDDGSTDDTPARVRRYGERVKYIRKANGGMASAMNRGLTEATGDWIWCFADDDAALPNGLEHLLRGLAVQRDADFVYGGQITGHSAADGRIAPGHAVLPPAVAPGDLFLHALRNIPFLMPAALVRRERFTALNGFDESYARSQDYHFLLRLLVEGRGVRVPEPIFVWRSHDGPRGPEHFRHDGAMRERVWMEVAGRLGRELRGSLPLAAFLPSTRRDAGRPVAKDRMALLHRMAVMASKGLVKETLVDLRSAANMAFDGPGHPLNADESSACREIGNFPFFQMRLLDAPDRITMRLAAAGASPCGKAILARIARGILHAARHSDRAAADRRVLLRCALRLFRACGPIRTASAFLPAGRR